MVCVVLGASVSNRFLNKQVGWVRMGSSQIQIISLLGSGGIGSDFGWVWSDWGPCTLI